MTDLILDDNTAVRGAADFAPRYPAAIALAQDSAAIGCAPPPMALHQLAQRTRRPSSWLRGLPGHGWRDVAVAWFLMAAAAAVLAGCLSLRGPEPPASAGYRLPSWVDTQSSTD